jgi:predicted ATPase
MPDHNQTSSFSRQFVGRAAETVEIDDGLSDALASEGRLFLISGEAGIGKTRLAEEMSARARQRGLRVIWGRCWEGDGAPAYWPWTQVFRACVAAGDRHFEQSFGIESPAVISLVPEFAPPRRSSTVAKPRLASLADAQEARFRLFDSAALLLKHFAASSPLMIVLDDLQNADHSSLLMLRFIVRELKDAPALVLVTFRDAEVNASHAKRRLIGEIAREGREIALRGFSNAELGQFIEHRIGATADPAIVATLMRATGGNPLFVDGALRILIAERQPSCAELPNGNSCKVPAAVHETIEQRLDILSDRANEALIIGAIIGQEFDFDCLKEVSDQSAESLIEALAEARRDGLIIKVLTGGLRYRFAHDLIREQFTKMFRPESGWKPI